MDIIWQKALELNSDFEREGFAAGAEVVNAFQFTLIVSRDLSCLLEELLHPKSKWHGNLHARLLALTLVEYADDLRAILGRQFREAVLKLDGSPSAVEKLNGLLSGLHKFRRDNDEFLRSVRNITIAHREHNARQQADWISRLEPQNVQALGLELTEWTGEFFKYLTPIFLELCSAASSNSSVK